MVYRSRLLPPAGTSYRELVKHARYEYHLIQKRSPRRVPYVRAAYFNNQKIFVESFWEHLNQKPLRERRRRLKLFSCAIDLLKNNTFSPVILRDDRLDKTLYRFEGITADNQHFYVQVKENKKKSRRDFVSVFPARK